MRSTKLGTRLGLQVTAGTVLVMILFGVLNIGREIRNARHLLDARQERILEQLTIVIESALWNLDTQQIERIVHSYLIDPDIVSIRVLENDEVLSQVVRDDVDPSTLLDESGLGGLRGLVEGETETRQAAIVHDDAEIGVVEVFFTDRRIHREIRHAIGFTGLGIIFLVMVESLLVSLLIRRHVSEPLAEVVEAAHKVADGDVDVELSEAASAKEITELIEVFRKLVDYFREMGSVAAQIAAGDLHSKPAPRSSADVLGTSFLGMTDYLEEVAQTAEAISRGDLRHEFSIKSEEDVLGHALKGMVTYLRSMAHAASRIALGEVSTDFMPRSSEDVLGHAFERMTGYLREMSAVASTMASGDLRSEVLPRSPEDRLGNAFLELRGLRETFYHLVAESERVAGHSLELKKISGGMAGSAEQTSDRVRAVSTSSERISRRASEMATATSELASGIGRLSGHTEEVRNAVHKAVKVVKEAQVTIDDLDANTAEISDVVGVVSNIAKQTHLLAINAEIEAERAGRGARGMRVIAGRVRELAQETATSTHVISRRVEGIESRSVEAIDAISQVAEIISSVQDITIEMSASLEDQVATTDNIARDIGEAAAESREVSAAMLSLSAASRSASDSAVSVRDLARELAEVADRLRLQIERFRT